MEMLPSPKSSKRKLSTSETGEPDPKSRALFDAEPVLENNNQAKQSSQPTANNTSNSRSMNGNQKSSEDVPQLDENLYSRQLYVLGHEAMQRMAKSSVLIAGLGGVGVEVAKNIILGGVKSVTLHDNKNADWYDLAGQFYLDESSIGKNRAEESLKQLSELNPYVNVKVHKGSLVDAEFLSKFSVIVLTDSSLEEQLAINEIVHDKKIGFIVASTRGLFGQIFCDFGQDFVVTDVTGEPPASLLISAITQEKQGMVSLFEEARHGLENGDIVRFTEVKGMHEINGKEYPIKSTGTGTFTIGDTTQFSAYVNGGTATLVKQPKTIHFSMLKESIFQPQLVETDSAKFGRQQQVHIFFQALSRYTNKHGGLPRSWNAQDAEEFYQTVLALLKDRNVPADFINADLARLFAKQARGNLAPVNSFIGGTAAQEVMKACSFKFHPIVQWLYYDAVECLNEPENYPSEESAASVNSRTDGQVAVFGREFQEKLSNQRYFLVGAGAIGCEHLKNFAMLGVGTGARGQIVVTDMDIIEKSNLNRQFLFRPKDVGKPKSVVAAEATCKMNPNMKVVAHQNRVGVETEKVYDDDFFESLNGVANALDNIEARTYMDRKCVYYRLPLLESGTLGTKGNVQVVIPYLSESYSSSQDPPEKSIPICTLKNFPNAIEHTLQWARDDFEGIFTIAPEHTAQYLADPKFIERATKMAGNQPVEMLEAVRSMLLEKPSNFEDCVKWARIYFEKQYSHQIKQLLHNFPPDNMTTTGTPFWSGPKRCPHPLVFDANEPTHLAYVVAVANLRAYLYNLPQCNDWNRISSIVKSIPASDIPAFVPKCVKIATNDAELAKQDDDRQNEEEMDIGTKIRLLSEEIPQLAATAALTKIKPIDFEKDDDTNFHMDFIVAASNLRATNYEIAPADHHKSKLIAGRIIPAIATTTALISGLVFIEFYKFVQGCGAGKSMEPYKNSFVNLALPFIDHITPMGCAQQKYYDKEFTLWDRFEIIGDITLQEFIDHFKNVHRLNITMISSGNSLLYSFFLSADKLKERLTLKMTEVLKRVTKKKLEPWVKSVVFEICCNDDNDEDLEVPYVRYVLGNQMSVN